MEKALKYLEEEVYKKTAAVALSTVPEIRDYYSARLDEAEEALAELKKFISVNNSVSGNEGLPKSIKESPEVAVCWNCGKRLNYTIHGKTYSHCECGAAQ